MNPKISYVTIHGRTSYPYIGRSDLHLYDPTLKCLNNQSLQGFEWIVVDTLYDERKHFFKNKNLNFPVKHIPAKPNFWHKYNLPGVGQQYNKALTYADGDLVVFGQDGWVFHNDMLKMMWKHYRFGFFPMAWYVIDRSYEPVDVGDKTDNPPKYEIVPADNLNIKYSFEGYRGDKVEVDNRYELAFNNNTQKYNQHNTWGWFFLGCSSASLESLIKVNGIDMKFDGDLTLMDCDLGSRLEMAGYSNFLLDRELYFVRLNYQRPIPCTSNSENVTIKCNYALIWFNRSHKMIQANKKSLTSSDVDWIMNVWCPSQCEHRYYCRKHHTWQYPFQHTKNPDYKQWFKTWLDNQQIFDLEEERELRLDNDDKYERGTYIE